MRGRAAAVIALTATKVGCGPPTSLAFHVSYTGCPRIPPSSGTEVFVDDLVIAPARVGGPQGAGGLTRSL